MDGILGLKKILLSISGVRIYKIHLPNIMSFCLNFFFIAQNVLFCNFILNKLLEMTDLILRYFDLSLFYLYLLIVILLCKSYTFRLYIQIYIYIYILVKFEILN